MGLSDFTMEHAENYFMNTVTQTKISSIKTPTLMPQKGRTEDNFFRLINSSLFLVYNIQLCLNSFNILSVRFNFTMYLK
jgi:hypothetical protein